MPAGRKKLSNTILAMRGSWRAKIPETTFPALPPVPPLRAPKELTLIERKHWRQVVPALAAMGHIALVDHPLLARYITYLAEWHQGRQALQAGETFVTGDDGELREHPWAQRLLKLEQILLRMEASLGMSPLARLSLKLPFTGQESAADADDQAGPENKAQFFRS